MLVLNTGKRIYMHQIEKDGEPVVYKLKPSEKAEIPDDIASIWIKGGEVQQVADDKKDAEIAKLKAENAKLKKATTKTTKKKK